MKNLTPDEEDSLREKGKEEYLKIFDSTVEKIRASKFSNFEIPQFLNPRNNDKFLAVADKKIWQEIKKNRQIKAESMKEKKMLAKAQKNDEKNSLLKLREKYGFHPHLKFRQTPYKLYLEYYLDQRYPKLGKGDLDNVRCGYKYY